MLKRDISIQTIECVRLNDLPNLKDIFKQVKPEKNLLNEHDIDDITEEILPHLFEYMKTRMNIYNDKNEYKDVIHDYVYNEIYCKLEEIYPEEHIEHEVDYITLHVINLFYYIIPKRSLKKNSIIYKQDESYKQTIKHQLDIIEQINDTLPEQRTTPWYEMRYNLLSASDIWKALDSQSNQNALILKKCEPLNTEKYDYVNVNSPFHWGQRYEPVSQLYYEYEYDAEIKEYGCIPHQDKERCYFLGASPDGINVKYNNERYGRMLEIKNIYNREITGIPKKEYWIQTQLQMECCDLNECDFLECRFLEYQNEEEFEKDGNFLKNAQGYYKGIILQFYYNNKPYYEYPPFQINEADFNIWKEQMIEKNREKMFVGCIYWKLVEISCVLIQRNKVWFETMLPQFKNIWDTIVIERETGYEHRKPKRRQNIKNDVKNQKPDLRSHIRKLQNSNTENTVVTEQTSNTIPNNQTNNVKKMIINIDI